MANEKTHIFDTPNNTRLVLRLLYFCCAVLLLFDLVIHRHVLHNWENLFGFYALYGFVGCVILVLVAKEMRKVLMRDEDYSDRDHQETEQDKPHVDD